MPMLAAIKKIEEELGVCTKCVNSPYLVTLIGDNLVAKGCRF